MGIVHITGLLDDARIQHIALAAGPSYKLHCVVYSTISENAFVKYTLKVIQNRKPLLFFIFENVQKYG